MCIGNGMNIPMQLAGTAVARGLVSILKSESLK